MARRYALGIALIAAWGSEASAQESGPREVPAATAQDVSLEIGGIRARVVLRRGVALEGILPLGASHWERASAGMDYVAAESTDPAAGLRLFFVLGMEGAVFLRRSDIQEVKDLGVVSDEAASALRRNLLDERRRHILEQENLIKESLRKIIGSEAVEDSPQPKPGSAPTATPEATAGAPDGGTLPAAAPAAPAPAESASAPPPAAGSRPAAPAVAGPMMKEEEAKARAEARRRRGEELLEKYPPPDWSEKRLETILWRERVASIPPDEVEAVFVKESDVWIEALRRRETAARKAAGPPADGAGSPAPR